MPLPCPTEIRQLGDPALRRVCDSVSDLDERTLGLARRMAEVMCDSDGVGLAAPQLGVDARLIVYRPFPFAAISALVNPRVLDVDGDSVAGLEGCLSITGELYVVARHLRLQVGGVGLGGQPRIVEAEGFLARVIAHELDHLDGVMICDRGVALPGGAHWGAALTGRPIA